MQKGELIELPANNRVRLTMAAWNRLDKLAERASKNDATAWIINGAGSQAELAFPLPEILKAHCPNCNAHRKAEVMTRYIEAQEDNVIFVTVDDYRILKCRGCDAVYVQRVNVTYWEGGKDDFNHWRTTPSSPDDVLASAVTASHLCGVKLKDRYSQFAGRFTGVMQTFVQLLLWRPCSPR